MVSFRQLLCLIKQQKKKKVFLTRAKPLIYSWFDCSCYSFYCPVCKKNVVSNILFFFREKEEDKEMAEFLRTKLKPLDKATQSLTSEFLNIKKNNRNNPKDKWI